MSRIFKILGLSLFLIGCECETETVDNTGITNNTIDLFDYDQIYTIIVKDSIVISERKDINEICLKLNERREEYVKFSSKDKMLFFDKNDSIIGEVFFRDSIFKFKGIVFSWPNNTW